MAYKNTDGSSSISNEWGQWRYFNSAVEKLGAIKPAQVNINMPKLEVPEGNDWMKAIGGAIDAGNKIWEARKAYSNKKAEEYFKSHSLEQYKKDVTSGNVPFQDDFLAMDALKTTHGNMLMQAVSADFMERVNKNEFEGLTPEELDQKFFEFANEQLKGAAQDFGYEPNDVAFTNGFFSDSPDKRLKAMLQKTVVESSNLTDKAFNADSSTFIALIRGGANADTLNLFLDSVEKYHGHHYNSEHWNKLLTAGLSAMEVSPNGYNAIMAIKDRKIPNGGGITVGQYAGEDKIKTHKVRAENNKFQSDTRKMYNFELGLQQLAKDGSVGVLMQMRDDLLLQNGNIETDQIKLVQQYLKQAYTNQASGLKKTEEDAEKSKRATNIALRLGSGEFVDSTEFIGLTANDLDIAAKNLSGEEGAYKELAWNIASNPSASGEKNIFRTENQKVLTKAINTFNGYSNLIATNRADEIPKKDEDIANEIKVALDWYRNDPVNFRQATGASDEQEATIEAMSYMLDAGYPFEYAVRGQAGIKELKKNPKGRSDIQIAVDKMEDVLVEITSVGGKFEGTLDARGKNIVRHLAYSFYNFGLEPEEAVTAAKNSLGNSQVAFMGATVPRNFFMVDKIPNGVEISQKIFEKVFGKELKDYVVSYKEWDEQVEVENPETKKKTLNKITTGKIVVTTTDGKELKTFSMKDIHNAIRAVNKHRAFLENKKVEMGGIMGSNYNLYKMNPALAENKEPEEKEVINGD